MPLIWETVEPSYLASWMRDYHRKGPPPGAFELMPPTYLSDSGLISRFGPVGDEARADWSPGGLDVRLEGFSREQDQYVVRTALVAAAEIDQREIFLWEDLDEEEAGSPEWVASSMSEEYWLSIAGVHPVGPGGRVTYYRSARRLEIAFHARGAPLQGIWRDPELVAREALNAFGGQLGEGERLRAGFGYYEASTYERQDLIRPVFVVLVDNPHRGAGPRWRLASVHAATDITGAPPTAGLESITGCA